MSKKKSTHVVPNKECGGWDIRQSGSERSSGHFDIKKKLTLVQEKSAVIRKLS